MKKLKDIVNNVQVDNIQLMKDQQVVYHVQKVMEQIKIKQHVKFVSQVIIHQKQHVLCHERS